MAYIGQVLGHYQLLSLLGRGGFADVYQGKHIHLNNIVAVKVLHTRLAEDLQEYFLQEARILVSLSHPRIIRILDFGLEEGIPYLVMDYAPGGSLRQRHARNTRLPLKTVVDYTRQIADSLQYVHNHRLIHRDLKPDNVLIGQQGNLLLSDFGVALIVQTTRQHDTPDDPAGTAPYMAPEQLQGKAQFASDQYALGIMVYEWLCGTRPFQGTLVELYYQHSSTPPTPLRDHVPTLPSSVEQVVLKALAKVPDQRFSSIKEFAHALEQASLPAEMDKTIQPARDETTQPELDETTQIAWKDAARPQSPVATPDQPQLHSDQLLSPTIASTRDQSVKTSTTSQAAEPPSISARSGGFRKRSRKMNTVLIAGMMLFLIVGSGFTFLYIDNFSLPDHHQASGNKRPQPIATSTVLSMSGQATPTISPTYGSTSFAPTPASTGSSKPTPAPNVPTSSAPTPTGNISPSPTPSQNRVTPTPPVCPPIIQSGSTGNPVKMLQHVLNAAYKQHTFPNAPHNFSPPLAEDGDFGPATQAAVEDYQMAKNLLVDGIVGSQTWQALGYC